MSSAVLIVTGLGGLLAGADPLAGPVDERSADEVRIKVRGEPLGPGGALSGTESGGRGSP
jgi:hypothetical protein